MYLERDASMQVEHGEVVDFLSEARPADLAFFENEEGKIIHVGVLVNSHQIIHASGCVKKEIIDSQGIISSQTGEYSHRLRVIKRLL
jgi:cell wall-associated NlpC family hydrolase